MSLFFGLLLFFPIRPILLLYPLRTATRAASEAPRGYGTKEKESANEINARICCCSGVRIIVVGPRARAITDAPRQLGSDCENEHAWDGHGPAADEANSMRHRRHDQRPA